MTSDPRTMDARLQGNPQLQHRVNGGSGRSSRPGEDDTLQYLSREEQECLKFFEKTIDSLDESLEPVDGAPTSNPTVSSLSARQPDPKDQDIIYLVSPEPELVQTKEPIFNPSSPDFQSMMTQNPVSHFEMKPRQNSMDGLPSEYNPPLPSGSYGSTDNHSSYHPPGCIPTPVLIAQQMADNRGGGTNLHSSSFLRSHNQESDKPQSPVGDLHLKHGPPTSAKPSRFPANISVTHSNKEHQNQSRGNVNIQDRRAQMLANLSGTSNPLVQEDPQPAVEPTARNIPTRNISFKDPSPDKSRMEALSKLGLNRNQAMSEEMSLLATPSSTFPNPPTHAETSAKPMEASAPPTTDTTTKLPEANVTTPRQSPVDRKPEILRSDSLKRFDDRNHQLSSYYPPPPLDKMSSFPPPPEVTSLEFNSYGGKSINVNPSVSTRSESTTPSSHEPKVLPTALANPSEFNPYGGKTKVMAPAPVATTRSDLPDILSSHINKGQTLPAKSEPLPIELNSYGGKSRTFNPTTGLNRPSDSPARSFKAPVPTPRPRHSYHGDVTPQKPAQRAFSPDRRRRSTSMFRPQGITVQFSGRGAMDEPRREALRKLGLLKESL
ncbi:uncharacterized protein proser2 [Lycodopsis pacificus]